MANRRTWWPRALVLAALMVGSASAAEKPQYSGTFSTLEFNEEGGDLLGVELRIVPVPGGYGGTIQVAEGSPGQLTLIHPTFDGDTIRFSIPQSSADAGEFQGRISVEGVRGAVKMKNGNSLELDLPRRSGYWDRHWVSQSCEIDLDRDGRDDVALLLSTRDGAELVVLLARESSYETLVLSRRDSMLALACRRGDSVAETKASRGSGATHGTGGTYLTLSQPEGASFAFHWTGSKFQEVQTGD